MLQAQTISALAACNLAMYKAHGLWTLDYPTRLAKKVFDIWGYRTMTRLFSRQAISTGASISYDSTDEDADEDKYDNDQLYSDLERLSSEWSSSSAD